MKIFTATIIILVSISFIFLCSSASGQAVSPSHLFKAGLNMGLLSGHVKNKEGKENYGTWAGNASAEWIESWGNGMVQPIIPDIITPSVAHNDMIFSITQMENCFNPYFQARLSLYKAGFHLGEALSQTSTSCSQCLQIDMQRAAIELRTISALTKKSLFSDLSDNLNSISASLNMNYSSELSTQQNNSQFTPINTVVQEILRDLPSEMQQCEATVKPETAVVVAPGTQVETNPTKTKSEKTKAKDVDKRNKRAFILKAGINKGSLRGSDDLKTDSKTGWLVGFDMYNGRKVFFVSSFKFWRNSTGEELMLSTPSQWVDPVEYYIQGFTLGFGMGGYVYKREVTNISLTGKFNYIISQSINGDLNSSGDTFLESSVFQMEFGAQFAYKLIFIEASYEFGLNDTLVSGNNGYKYGLFNLSIGAYIR